MSAVRQLSADSVSEGTRCGEQIIITTRADWEAKGCPNMDNGDPNTRAESLKLTASVARLIISATCQQARERPCSGA